jgi:diguanylate cyclase
MSNLVYCLTHEHSIVFVLIAAAICVAGAAGAFMIMSMVDRFAVRARQRWVMLAGLAVGVGAWATHFVAMLGYAPGVPLGFDPLTTALSALAAMLGAWLALAMFDHDHSEWGRVRAGLVLGAAIALMHYLGMAGIEAAAQRLWHANSVAASVAFSAAFSLMSFEAFHWTAKRARVAGASFMLSLAILALHFFGMSAVHFVADPTLTAPHSLIDRNVIAIIVAMAVAAILLVGVVLALSEQRVAAMAIANAEAAALAALCDPLTGLANRLCLGARLPALLAQTARMAVVVIDLDRFKPINDLYGHAAGDELLIRIGELISREAGASGLAARMGGDEFVLAKPYGRREELLQWLADFAEELERPIRLGAQEVSVGATMGVAFSPEHGDEGDLLIRRADIALYRTKQRGRGGFAVYEAGMDKAAQARAALERDLRQAVRDDLIEPHFQPLVSLKTEKILGYEVLARWTHPSRGAVEPSEFIKVAEEIGLIGELTINVLRRACLEAGRVSPPVALSLNISPAQLRDPALPQKLLAVVTQCGYPPALLEVEITEEALVAEFDAARAILTSLKNVGVSVALDDFGTGYSSLRRLRELPFDVIKIDRSFVRDMKENAEASAIVRTIIELAKHLGLHVTAEGVETSEQAAALGDLGCEMAQGFFFGRPAPFVSFSAGEAKVSVGEAAIARSPFHGHDDGVAIGAGWSKRA